jgi:hypothetical protein
MENLRRRSKELFSPEESISENKNENIRKILYFHKG